MRVDHRPVFYQALSAREASFLLLAALQFLWLIVAEPKI